MPLFQDKFSKVNEIEISNDVEFLAWFINTFAEDSKNDWICERRRAAVDRLQQLTGVREHD